RALAGTDQAERTGALGLSEPESGQNLLGQAPRLPRIIRRSVARDVDGENADAESDERTDEDSPRIEIAALLVDEHRPALALVAVTLAANDRRFRADFDGGRPHWCLPFAKLWRILASSPSAAWGSLSTRTWR